jgi:hypothetical protein
MGPSIARAVPERPVRPYSADFIVVWIAEAFIAGTDPDWKGS